MNQLPVVDREVPAWTAPAFTEGDEDWLKQTVPEHLQKVARSYGRLCYSLVMQAGMLQFALGRSVNLCQRALPGRVGKEVVMHCQRVGMIGNDLIGRVLKDNAVPAEIFHRCKEQVEQIGSLAAAAPGVNSGGRIIVPN